MQISLFLKLKNKIDNDEFLKQELKNLFGEENLSQVLLSLTDEQLIDILDNTKNNKEVLYLIFIYNKEQVIPEDIRKLIEEKLTLEPNSLDIVCEMLDIFNQDKLLEREDLKEIIDLIINAPQERAKIIINVFKEVDLSKRDNVVDFIRIILGAKEEYQVQYASQTYVALMKEKAFIESEYESNLNCYSHTCGNLFRKYNKINQQTIDGIKNNILQIIELVVNADAVYKSKLIFELVTSRVDESRYDNRYITIASLSNTIAVCNMLANSKGEKQANKLVELYKHLAFLYYGESRREKYKDDTVITMQLKALDIIAKAEGSSQAEKAAEYLYAQEWQLRQEKPDCYKIPLSKVLSDAQVIAGWKNGNQLEFLIGVFKYDISKWNTFGDMQLLDKLSEKYSGFRLRYLVSRYKDSKEILKMLLNIEDKNDRKVINHLIWLLDDYCDTKYYLRYVEALLKVKDKLILCLVFTYMTGINYIDDLESDYPSINSIFIHGMSELMNENQVRIIINILKETGLGFITDLDDEESIQRVERMANSKEPIEVTLKSLMGLSVDMVEDVLSGQSQEEVELDSKILLFSNTSK